MERNLNAEYNEFSKLTFKNALDSFKKSFRRYNDENDRKFENLRQQKVPYAISTTNKNSILLYNIEKLLQNNNIKRSKYLENTIKYRQTKLQSNSIGYPNNNYNSNKNKTRNSKINQENPNNKTIERTIEKKISTKKYIPTSNNDSILSESVNRYAKYTQKTTTCYSQPKNNDILLSARNSNCRYVKVKKSPEQLSPTTRLYKKPKILYQFSSIKKGPHEKFRKSADISQCSCEIDQKGKILVNFKKSNDLLKNSRSSQMFNIKMKDNFNFDFKSVLKTFLEESKNEKTQSKIDIYDYPNNENIVRNYNDSTDIKVKCNRKKYYDNNNIKVNTNDSMIKNNKKYLDFSKINLQKLEECVDLKIRKTNIGFLDSSHTSATTSSDKLEKDLCFMGKIKNIQFNNKKKLYK